MVIYLGLGSNRGDRRRHLQEALADLARCGVEPLRVSPLYETAYVGPGGPQPHYLNAVVEARTGRGPLELLEALQAIEAHHGRAPGSHLAPRRLDLDVLLYGGWTVWHPRLVIPHPRLERRRFVLLPLRDLGVLERRPELHRALEALSPAAQPVWPAPGGLEMGRSREAGAG